MLKVAVIDEEHEKDLQHEINEFLKKLSEDQLVDIKYDVSAACDPQGEQLYCFSALILYRT
ncbi:sporulation protein Cse60 [Bacillus licheniformis]|uniref:sporulation protein Cse60 n=1 Tax=Bacillus licheniformis TaxID=1402 RepID=UPI000928E745|nr:sporulation protein Cse60 [Bacillus licheniformis]OJT56230.1 sporulation protein cse60 [Bacillus licheniformis]OJT69624.1 sporulation protein cse60 [Bacillus licheniformis]